VTWEIITGDVLAAEPSGKFDAVLCDPPYGLSFMGKAWDHGVPGREFWERIAGWCRPGAHLMAFGGTRTAHRLTCAIEDAGWDIRDSLCWLYGSGFPKNHAVGKAIDKAAGVEREVVGTQIYTAPDIRGASYDQPRASERERLGVPITDPATPDAARWEGHGTALKPGHEIVSLARLPLDGTVAHNALEHGCGALNIEGGRIGTGGEKIAAPRSDPHKRGAGAGEFCCSTRDTTKMHEAQAASIERTNTLGRWPANVLLDHAAAEALDEMSGDKMHAPGTRSSREFKGWRAVGDLKKREGVINDTGGASRFFYTAKASKRERNAGLEDRNTHPTVKPVDLCRYLATLLLPPPRADGAPRRIVVPFSGSGSEMIGAHLAGWDEIVGVEMSSEFVAIATARLNHWTRQQVLA
jgi:site-specific DNA-methyltransferase (adenine-specific)